MPHPLSGATAVVGLGITPQGKVYGSSPLGFAVDAVALALADAGLERTDLDGLLLNPGLAGADMGMGSFQLQQAMGLRDLRLSATMNLGGATACAMIQHAAQAIAAGLATTVACVFSDAPLKPERPEGQRSSSGSADGFVRGWEAAYGYFGVNAMYALVARRHMHRYGTTQDHLGAVAVAQRRWANLNPAAQMHEQPLTLEDYHRSRWIVEPFHLFDCCLVSNGGLAVIVTGRERARDSRKPSSRCAARAGGTRCPSTTWRSSPATAASSPRTRRSSSPGSPRDRGLREAPPADHARDGALLGGRAPPRAGRAALPRLRRVSLPGARPVQPLPLARGGVGARLRARRRLQLSDHAPGLPPGLRRHAAAAVGV